MTQHETGALLGATSPIWLSIIGYYAVRACLWLDGRPWGETS